MPQPPRHLQPTIPPDQAAWRECARLQRECARLRERETRLKALLSDAWALLRQAGVFDQD